MQSRGPQLMDLHWSVVPTLTWHYLTTPHRGNQSQPQAGEGHPHRSGGRQGTSSSKSTAKSGTSQRKLSCNAGRRHSHPVLIQSHPHLLQSLGTAPQGYVLFLKVLSPPQHQQDIVEKYPLCSGFFHDPGSLTALHCPSPGGKAPGGAAHPWEMLEVLGDAAHPHCYSWKPRVAISSCDQPLDTAQTSKSKGFCQAGGSCQHPGEAAPKWVQGKRSLQNGVETGSCARNLMIYLTKELERERKQFQGFRYLLLPAGL